MQTLLGALEPNNHHVCLLLRVNAMFRRRLLDLLTVLVRSGQEQGFRTPEPGKSGQHVSQNGRICVAQVWLIVDVVYGCRYIKRF